MSDKNLKNTGIKEMKIVKVDSGIFFVIYNNKMICDIIQYHIRIFLKNIMHVSIFHYDDILSRSRRRDERARNWHTFSVEFVADQPQEGKINDRKKHAL